MPFHFTSELKMPATTELQDGDTWILREPFAYVRSNGERIFVPPSGFGTESEMLDHPVWTTDYGSIPMLFQNQNMQHRWPRMWR